MPLLKNNPDQEKIPSLKVFFSPIQGSPTSVKAKIRTDYGLLASERSSQETGSCTWKRGDTKYVRYRQICLRWVFLVVYLFFPTREHYEGMWDYCSDPTSHLTASPLRVKPRISMRWCTACTRVFWAWWIVFLSRRNRLNRLNGSQWFRIHKRSISPWFLVRLSFLW